MAGVPARSTSPWYSRASPRRQVRTRGVSVLLMRSALRMAEWCGDCHFHVNPKMDDSMTAPRWSDTSPELQFTMATPRRWLPLGKGNIGTEPKESDVLLGLVRHPVDRLYTRIAHSGRGAWVVVVICPPPPLSPLMCDGAPLGPQQLQNPSLTGPFMRS